MDHLTPHVVVTTTNPLTHAVHIADPGAAVALDEFLSEIVRGASSVGLSRDAKTLTPAHVKAHVMMEPMLDFCKGVVARAPDLTEEGADGDKPKRARKPRAPAEGNSAGGKKRKGVKKVKKEESEHEQSEEEWKTEDEGEDEAGWNTDEEEAKEAREAKEAKGVKMHGRKRETGAVKEEDAPVDLGDVEGLEELAGDLIGEDDLEDACGLDGNPEEENYDDL